MPGTKSKHLVLRTYTFQKFFFLFVKKIPSRIFTPNHHSIAICEFCAAKIGLFPDISKPFCIFLHHHAIFLQKYSSRTTRFKLPLPLCRAFEYLSLHTHQIVEEKLANVQKRPYLCGVKMKINEQLTIDFRDKNIK